MNYKKKTNGPIYSSNTLREAGESLKHCTIVTILKAKRLSDFENYVQIMIKLQNPNQESPASFKA